MLYIWLYIYICTWNIEWGSPRHWSPHVASSKCSRYEARSYARYGSLIRQASISNEEPSMDENYKLMSINELMNLWNNLWIANELIDGWNISGSCYILLWKMSCNVTKTNCDKTPLSHTCLIRKSFGKCTNNENKSGSGQGITDKTRLGPAQTVV